MPSPSATPAPAPSAERRAARRGAFSAAPKASLPCSGSVRQREEQLNVEVFPGSSCRGRTRDRRRSRGRHQRRQGAQHPGGSRPDLDRARPVLPRLPCQAIGSVTGFQVSNGQTRSPFIVPHDGKIKAWTLTLAQPTNKQRSFFNGFFGTPPEARLAILRRIPGTNPPRYNLRSQGSVKVLTPYLGQTVKFGSSLSVEKGDIVAITVPTWAPAFSQELNSKEVWRASREPGTCTNSTDIRQGEPLEKAEQARHVRLQVLDGPPSLHGDSRRGFLSR